MEQSKQQQQDSLKLNINKKSLHNKKEKQINSLINPQKQTKNQQDKLDLLVKQQQNIFVDSKDNLNIYKDTSQIIEAEDISNEVSTDFNHKITSQNKNVDLSTQICLKSQKSQKDSKNNLKLSKDTYQIIEQEDIITEQPTDINQEIILQNELVDQNISNCIKSQNEEEEKENSQNIKQIFDNQGKKMVNQYSEENKKIIYEKLYQNNYILEGYLKSGGEGDVFKGYRTKSEGEQQKIAFKIYSFENQEDLNEEINLIKQLGQHKLIVKVFDSFEIQIYYKKLKIQCLILVMELCQFSLHDELNDFKERQQFSFDQLLKIIFDLLDVVIKLRGHYTLHSDIKSKNILKNQDNSYCLTDFGISQKKKNRDQRLLFKGGTRGYMAQEQYPNSKLIDFKSDVFSLGKVFQIVMKEFQKINQNISQQQMNIINKFNQIIQEMLEPDIQKRKSAMKIYKQFFKQINNMEFFDFNKSFHQHLFQIIEQNDSLELWKDQDYLYQQKLEHFYDKIKLQISMITSNNQLVILILEYQISSYYFQNFEFKFILQLQKEFFDMENDWLIEMDQKLISNIIKLKNQNEYNFNKNKKGKEKLKQCYEKFKSYQYQPNYQISQQRQQFYKNERLTRICLFLAKYYFIYKNMNQANKFFEESLQFFKKVQCEYRQNEEEQKAHLFFLYGDYYLLVNNLEEAENYATKCYHMTQQLIDEDLLVVASLFLLGFICIKKGDLEKAQKYFKQIFSYEHHFENDDIYNQTDFYFLGYIIYLQIRQQKCPDIQDLKEDIFEVLEAKYNELEEKKSIQSVELNKMQKMQLMNLTQMMMKRKQLRKRF